MKITIFSHVCIDENIAEGAEYRSFGSPGMYMSLLLNNFEDVETTIISNYGTDFGEYTSKVNLYPSKPIFEKTMLNRNRYFKDGTRKSSSSFRENNLPVEVNEELKKIIENSGVMVIAPILPNYDKKYLKGIFQHTDKKTLKVLLPQGYFRTFDELDNQHFRNFKEADEILDLFDYVIISEEDYPEIDELAKVWTNEYDLQVIMTTGEKGAQIFTGGDFENVYTNPIDDVIDSVGAGDMFAASFVYKYFETKDDIKSIEFANKIAGKSLKYTPEDIIAGDVDFKR